MTGKTKSLVLLGMLVGIVLGGILGAAFPDAMLSASVVGRLYVNALALVATLLIFVGLPVAMTRFGDMRSFDSSQSRGFITTLATAVLAIGLGVLLVRLVAGLAINPSGLASLDTDFVQYRMTGDYIGTLLPESIIRAVLQSRYLGWVLFVTVFGLMLPTITSRGRALVNVLEEGTEALLRFADMLYLMAPIALLFITSSLVALSQSSLSGFFDGMHWYPIVLVLAIILYGSLGLPALYRYWMKLAEPGKQRVVSKGRPDLAYAGARPDRSGRPSRFDSRSREGRYDRGQRDRGRPAFRKDRPDRPERPDRPDRSERPDRQERPERVDRPDRPERGERPGRPDRPEVRTREESPFAVAADRHAFDPDNARPGSEPIETPTSEVAPESEDRRMGRPEGGPDRRDRGPRGRGGRDRRERGGRGRDRGRDRGDRPRRDRPPQSEEQEPMAGPQITLRDTGSYPETVDLSAGSEQAEGGAPDMLGDALPSRTEDLVGSDRVAGIARYRDEDRGEHVYTERGSEDTQESRSPLGEVSSERPEFEESSESMSYGRTSRGHRPDRSSDEPMRAESEPESHGTEPDEAKPVDGYTTEGMEFGVRNRRKRPRP